MKLITDTGELTDYCRAWHSSEFIAIDTEFMREKTFWPVLCLVQIAGEDAAAAIDPLAEGLDLTPLFELMADPAVLKVMHGGRQDIEIFHHLTGRVPGPIYDTQIAAMVCGFGDQVGYETLISKLTGERLDKGSRFTDWSLRPLSDKQLRYALDDVIYLRPAYENLRGQIVENGRASWLEEEMTALSAPSLYASDPQDAWRRLKPKSTSRRFLAVLKEVAAWREIEAMDRDVPRNRIIRDESLSQLAAHPPSDQIALARVRGISKGLADSRQGVSLMAALARGNEIPPDKAPLPIVKMQRASGQGPLVDLLKVLLKHKCEVNHVAQKLIASSSDLEDIAADAGDADVRALHGWRREVFGEDALRLACGDVALTATGGRIRLIDITDVSAKDGPVPGSDKTTGASSGDGTASDPAPKRSRRRRKPRDRIDVREVIND